MTIDDGRIDEAIRRNACSHRAALDAHRRAALVVAAATEALTRSRRVLGDAWRRRRPLDTEVLADEAARLRVELAGVRRTLESRSAMDQAKGMLKLQRGLTPDERVPHARAALPTPASSGEPVRRRAGRPWSGARRAHDATRHPLALHRIRAIVPSRHGSAGSRGIGRRLPCLRGRRC